jgi:hypothetical protein
MAANTPNRLPTFSTNKKLSDMHHYQAKTFLLPGNDNYLFRSFYIICNGSIDILNKNQFLSENIRGKVFVIAFTVIFQI